MSSSPRSRSGQPQINRPLPLGDFEMWWLLRAASAVVNPTIVQVFCLHRFRVCT